MIRSTPHPPIPLAHALPCVTHSVNSNLFIIKPGVSIEEALVTACEYIHGAAATAYEVADNHSPEFRPLARSVVNQLDIARTLLESSLEGLLKLAEAKNDG